MLSLLTVSCITKVSMILSNKGVSELTVVTEVTVLTEELFWFAEVGSFYTFV